ncbi:TRAP transporter small permease [Marinomonas sp. UCMA 3892]|jgi:C4-dicarboxylate transporter, DctQ subunit|uniref:TRAP transporter small permease protein n=1 Tax=Marinomonas polaris DSM 16579 TaxID=1122206 RepID=A0A1M5FIF0_9GAMM|nr:MULTISPECIES: TRAP transporter small permease [Marinomonas]MBU1293358.1 TRAP transporter small permease [Gammaproteobacteria bacterium]MBU1467497.1 TRAP transporter small permease [Gammaproteobacteria bacterium]MBU2024505.1 TRAP transporter small permease [Gammaproteobacteria bacterium]MBU2236624.1 TRAP transporter small permease [Gammaproteobacteria bacterium]MBU2319290.1 TRAP transporter small permease [Gammaproteobacteria bacterium]
MAHWPHLYLLIFIIVLWLLEKRFPKVMERAEENLLILVISSIMAVSFGQVIARYGFNTGWDAALEFNMVAFSWLILLGMSYGIKTNLHLGVDIVLNAVPKRIAKALSLFGAAAAMLYGLILLDSTWLAMLGVDVSGGAIEYWLKMFKIGIGSEELRYPEFVQEMFGLRPRVHRWIVLVVLPISLALLSYRSLQAFIDIARGKRDMLISGHEAQDLVKENQNVLKD